MKERKEAEVNKNAEEGIEREMIDLILSNLGKVR